MRTFFVLLTVLTSLAVLSGCAKLTLATKSRFSSGEKDIQAAYEAKQTAKSWRMKTKLSVHSGKVMETNFEISCPDRERITANVGGSTRETVRIGKTFYLNQDGTWYSIEASEPDWSPCGTNSGARSPWAMLNEGRELVTVFATTKDRFRFTRGPVGEANKRPCQTWQVAIVNANAPHGNFTACIYPDHFPAWVVMGQGGLITEYSDWNQPIQIEAPPNAIPYKEPAEMAPASAHHGQ